jgi:phage protein D
LSMYDYNGKILAIVYDVWISGTKLGIDKKECINQISIKETVVGSDSATIVIQDPEFLFIEDNIFLEDNKIKIMLGWDNTTYRVVFDGYISAIDITFASDGIPTLTITCMDNTHKMYRKKNNATFKNTTSANVVKQIVRNYGFQCVVDPSYKFEVQETITQSNQSDIEFITQLANNEVYPFTARLVGNTFYYVKMGELTTPKMTLTYKKYPHEIISFSPKINKEQKQVEIKSASIQASNKKVSKTTGQQVNQANSGSDKGSSTSNGSSSSKKASGGYTYNPKTKTWTHH